MATTWRNDLHTRALEVWDVAWEEFVDEFERTPTPEEHARRALEVDRGNK